MDNNFKILIGSVIATIVIIVVAVFLFSSNGDTPTTADAAPIDSQILVRDNGYNTKGPSGAPVTLVEFADFQCPGCKATTGIIKAIANKYPEQVQIIYRHFPLPQHPLAQPAAAAAEAAGAQGKFWEMHDLIFANQEDLKMESFEQFAQELELNLEQFNTDRQADAFRERVIGDLTTGNQIGVNSTPTIFINGKKFTQNMSVDAISTVIEQELASQLLPSDEQMNATTSGDSNTATPSAETSEATESAE